MLLVVKQTGHESESSSNDMLKQHQSLWSREGPLAWQLPAALGQTASKLAAFQPTHPQLGLVTLP